MQIVLGSQSPRRQEILSFFQIPFTVCSSGFDESTVAFTGCPANYVHTQAKQKALALQPSHSKTLILTADTTVFFKNKLLQKPSDEKEAFLFLEELSGNTHEVHTAICVAFEKNLWVESAKTNVTFHALTEAQIHQYIRKIDPLDKAGAYAIQGIGSLIVSSIQGCYYNVMGLPINILVKLFKKAGIDLWQ